MAKGTRLRRCTNSSQLPRVLPTHRRRTTGGILQTIVPITP
jgi:hypothetical protein